jgi:hypothetical protein
MASRALFKGSPCKVSCRGHRAGFAYASRGGMQFSRSTSFNNGMMIYLKQLPRRRR